jgi:hypothetical protein
MVSCCNGRYTPSTRPTRAAATTGRRRGEGAVLFLQSQRAGQPVDVDIRTEVELLGEPGDLADAGEEHEHVPVLVA